MRPTLRLPTDVGLLLLRIGAAGLMLFVHGIGKVTTFTERVATYPDPIGIGSTASMALTILAEVLCSLLVIIGLGTRIASSAICITMLVAALIVHASDPFTNKELPLLFAIAFLTLVFTGAGKFSLDSAFKKQR